MTARWLVAVALAGLGCAGPQCHGDVELDGPPMRLRAWLPTDEPTARRTLVNRTTCDSVAVGSTAAWLDARLEGDELVVTGDPAAAGPGRHRADVTLSIGGGRPFPAFEVVLSVLSRAPESGERHALVVGIDGCRPDAIVAADAPNLDALTALGRATYTASTQLTTATVSGPGWASVLTSVEASDHLVDGNDDLTDIARDVFPTFLRRAQLTGLEVGLSTQWIGISTLVEPEISATATVGTADRVEAGARALLAMDVDLVFVHFDDVDHAGHDSGFLPTNPAYLEAIESVDARVGRLVDDILARPTFASERWLVALTTDHGGSATGHGALDPENRTIFLILFDLGGDPAVLPATGVSHMDVGPSVLTHLGIAVDPAWMLDGVAR